MSDADFDAAVAEFEEFVIAQGGEPDVAVLPPGFQLPDLEDILAGRPTEAPASGTTASVARRIIYDAFLVVKKAGTMRNPGDGERFAGLVHILLADYKAAWQKELDGRSAIYKFSSALRKAKDTLARAYDRIKQDAETLKTMAAAMGGTASLIAALG